MDWALGSGIDNVELFKIACPTCATRLKVGQASAVGQILACPKCGSMIQITPPEGWVPPPTVAAEVPAPTTAKRPIVKPPGTPELPDTASKPFEDFDDIESLLSAEPTTQKSPSKSPSKPVAGSVTPQPTAVNRSTPSRLPINTSQFATSVPRKKLFLQVAAVATLVVVSLVLIVVLTNALFRPDSNELGARPDKPNKATPSVTADKPNSAADENGDVADHPPETEQPNPPTVTNGNGSSSLNAQAMIAPLLEIPAMSVTTAAPTAPPGFEPPQVVAKAPQQPSLIDQFGDMNNLLEGDTGQGSLQALEDATSADRGQIGIGTVFVRKPDPQPVDVALGLAVPVNKISFPGIPLVDAMRTFSDLSNVPICYEVELLAVHGVDITQPITIELTGTTVRQALEQILQPQGLVAVEQPTCVLITTRDRTEWSTQDYALQDYGVDDPAIAQKFAEYIEANFATASWKSKGGEGTLQVDGTKVAMHQTAPVHALVKILLSKLSAAQTLALNPADAAASEPLLSRTKRSQTARQSPVHLKLSADQPLEHLLTQIAAETGTHVVINWQALAGEGWTHRTLVPWESDGEPLERPLRALTDSMNLTLRAIDDHLLQITTHADAQSQLELEVYPCGDLLEKYTVEQLTGIFDTVLGASVDPNRGMSVTLESTCRCWVAILPQPLQRRFEAGLTQLRNDLAATR